MDIFKKTLWPGKKGVFYIGDFLDILHPRRSVSDKKRYISGSFDSVKCGRVVQYESGIELAFIEQHLEGNENVLFYWEQPVKIPYWRGKIKVNYYPDFGVLLSSGHFVIVEVKGLAEMIDHRVQAKTEGLMEFCHKRGFGLLLTDGRHTPEDAVKGKVNRQLEKAIRDAVDQGPVRSRQARDIMKACGASMPELLRAVVRLDLKFKPFPFKLQRGRQSPLFRQVYFGKKSYEDLVWEYLSSKFTSAQ